MSPPISWRVKVSAVMVWVIVAALPSLAVGAVASSMVMNIVLVNERGQEVRLGEVASGKPTLLFFWATWCQSCRKVQPSVAALAEKYRGRVQVIGINVGGLDSVQAVNDYRQRHGITYPLLVDRVNQVAEAYDIVAIPTVILLDRQGQVRFRDVAPPATLDGLL
ncbi:MAG TPA: TlpA disulfide reductase family protein [Syntrophobacteria bacterium]|nr:TlpA disulfide reductase family protein [Syntrophobacteria bacterium]